MRYRDAWNSFELFQYANIDRQNVRERTQVEAGIARYYKRQKELTGSERLPGRRIRTSLLDRVADHIELTQKLTEEAHGRTRSWATLVKGVAPAILASHGLRAAINAACEEGRKNKRSTAAIHIGRWIYEQIRREAFVEAFPAFAKVKMEEADKIPEAHIREYRMIQNENYILSERDKRPISDDPVQLAKELKFREIRDNPWDIAMQKDVGAAILGCVMRGTGGILEYQKKRDNKDYASTRIVLSREAFKHAEELTAMYETDTPVYKPMLVPPIPWENNEHGGYLDETGDRPLLTNADDAQIRAFNESPPTSYLSAINTLQDCPWRINQFVYDVVVALKEKGDSLLPTQPPCVDMNKLSFVERAQMKSMASKWRSLIRTVDAAEELTDEDAFWHVHIGDTRSRFYTANQDITVQKDDVARGLCEFATPTLTTEFGVSSIAIRTASCFALDGCEKLSQQGRIDWTNDHIEEILESARKPLADDAFWRKAEDPFQALACCRALLDWHNSPTDHFMCRLPVSIDGTANAFQHGAALLKDPVSAARVGLLPTDEPVDSYVDIVAVMQRMLTPPFNESVMRLGKNYGKPVFAYWKPENITRKLIKTPLMTAVYGVKKDGRKKQIRKQVMKLGGLDHLTSLNKKELWEAVDLLVDILVDAVNEVNPRPLDGMTYLQTVCKYLTRAQKHPMWTTPLGFPVMLRHYKKIDDQRDWVYFDDQRERVSSTLYDRSKVNGHKHRNSIAANFTHSLDATHMAMTVNVLAESGITDIGTVHDSIWVPAEYVDEAHYALRQEWDWLYGEGQDWYRDFEGQAMEQLSLRAAKTLWTDFKDDPELNALRTLGDLDVSLVHDADYFFH